jgi:hypothetical protein
MPVMVMRSHSNAFAVCTVNCPGVVFTNLFVMMQLVVWLTTTGNPVPGYCVESPGTEQTIDTSVHCGPIAAVSSVSV